MPAPDILRAMPSALRMSVAALVLLACGGDAPPPAMPAAASSAPSVGPVGSAAPPPPASVVVTPSPEVPPRPQQDKLYALVVSFISPGDGTDARAHERLRAVVSDISAPRVGHVRGSWGKEGEHDECFDLGGLAYAEKKAFLQRVRFATTSDRVTITENARCRHERD